MPATRRAECPRGLARWPSPLQLWGWIRWTLQDQIHLDGSDSLRSPCVWMAGWEVEAWGVRMSARVYVVVRVSHRVNHGRAEGLRNRVGSVILAAIVAAADRARVFTWSKPAHVPDGRALLSNSANATGRMQMSQRHAI